MRKEPSPPWAFLILTCALILGGTVHAELYKYRGENGEWIYTDRAPQDEEVAEVRELPSGEGESGVIVGYQLVDEELVFSAKNDYHAPIEVVVALDKLSNVGKPSPLQKFRWVVPARATRDLLRLPVIDLEKDVSADFRYIYLHGEPGTEHAPTEPYRVPFGIAGEFPVTQAFPTGITHVTPDSYHAIDIAMPIGTDVHAARGGVVFEVASTNFRSGLDAEKDFPSANVVRVLHSDGTHAVYAHLNWNSIRVRPGDVVERGEFIAESGNTGFTTGPHLHFAVIRNRGMGLESLPIVFKGRNGQPTVPQTGSELAAY